MPSIFDANNQLAAAYMSRNPQSILAMAAMAARRKVNSAPSSDVGGSNNAGGLASPATGVATAASMRNRDPYLGSYGNSSRSLSGRLFTGNGTEYMDNMPQYGGNNSSTEFNSSPISFAAGGMMTPAGGAIRPGDGMMETGPQLGATAELSPQQIEQEAQNFVQQHPEEAQKVQEVIALAMQTGDLTPEELNTAVQLAKTALASPQSYPQIRQFAIKNGLGTEQDIPQQMDQGLLYVLVVAGKAMQPTGNAMNAQPPSATAQPKPSGVVPEYREGGMTGDKAHIAKLHPREYVATEKAVLYHGLKKYHDLERQAEEAGAPNDSTK